MLLPDRLRSLLAQSIFWIVLPFSLVLFGVIVAGTFAYQHVVTSLLLDRDRQLATLSAARVSEAMESYARVLEALASTAAVQSEHAVVRTAALQGATASLDIFNAGVVLVDRDGALLGAFPIGAAPVSSNVAQQPYFLAVRAHLRPDFSDVLTDARTGQDMIVVAVPVVDETEGFAGALIGAVHLHNTPLGEPVRKLVVGDEGFAYLVDGRGRVIFHPEPENIGADFSDRPFVQKVIAGESGGTLWDASTDERLVLGFAPVTAAGWGLVVRESWQEVVAPAQAYGGAAILAGLSATVVTALLVWRGVRRVTEPVRQLAGQASRLAAGESVEPVPASGVLEIDALERAFEQMGSQIAAYRAGLRRYVGAVTKSQEDERDRIARDLHDETIQSLLAISRGLELHQASEGDPARLARLVELQGMVTNTVHGVRQIYRDLRPLVLDDLGLAPALRTLLQDTRSDAGTVTHAQMQVSGEPAPLRPEQELSLYRITQEALANVRKHAQASSVEVSLTFEAAAVRLEVHDDGVGFSPPASAAEFAQRGHFGLMGMQERVWAVGGLLSIDSSPGAGTRLSVTLPLERDGSRDLR